MLFNDPNYCMGNRTILQKAAIAWGILANPWLFVLDKLKLVRQPQYLSRTGVKFRTRPGTTDVNDAIVVLSGKEYPPALVGIKDVAHPVVMDCGGHIGSFSLYIKNLNPTAKLLILEPSSDNLVMLRANLALNQITDAVVIDKALYGQSGQYYLDIDDKPFDAGELVTQKPAGHKYLEINAVALPELLAQQQLDKLDLLKLDIEGSEYNVVQTNFAFLSQHVKRVIMEYHVTAKADGRNFLVNYLTQQAGFELIYESKNVLGFANRSLN